MTNQEWVQLISKEFNVSRTIAKKNATWNV